MRQTILSLAIVTVVAIIPAAQERTDNNKQQSSTIPKPLILQDNDGDHLVHRAGPLGGVPFTIKVDSQFGNSEDFFVFAETLAPGQVIPFHMHHNAEEILLFEEAGAWVIVGNTFGNAGAHSLIFIPGTPGFQLPIPATALFICWRFSRAADLSNTCALSVQNRVSH